MITSEEIDLLKSFQNKLAKVDPEFVTDFLGVRHRVTSLWPTARELAGILLDLPIPGDFHADAIEWIGLLKAISYSTERFSMLELGAGYGTWSVAGAVAAKKIGIPRVDIYAVEADARHFADMPTHFSDNGFDPSQSNIRLIHAAVWTSNGTIKWPKVYDEGWGLSPLNATGHDNEGRHYAETIDIPCVSLTELLSAELEWTLVQFDVQGGEVELIHSALAILKARVRWMVIGTHSRDIEDDLVACLVKAGWRLEKAKPAEIKFNSKATTIQAMTIKDGTQVWSNL
jgi:FkbM family methyltransferase